METIYFVGCTKNKQDYACSAKEMYSKSVLFKKQIAYINKISDDDYYILSAKYGLVHPDHKIEPYDISLYNMKQCDYRKWCEYTRTQMTYYFDVDNIHAIFLCGNKYRQEFLSLFNSYEEPFKGYGIGQQIKKINEVINR